MAMDPIVTKNKIQHDYTEYLSSILEVRDKEINRKVALALKSSRFTKGPYLEATLPFNAGRSLADLAREGIVSKEFAQIREDIHYDRPLYLHQDKAVEKITEGKNVIVATGTGSGKTECYMLPIFNYLMREKEKGTLGPGVRALLLFPMNALANDQVKKLRQLLINYPDITFGRYTGETEGRKTEEQVRKQYAIEHNGQYPLQNEMLTRQRMQETPPHILLTNYAMLEYLLLRPRDSEFFDGDSAKSWKFIVIDEAHTYKGSNGTEIAILLRRLKERIHRHSNAQLTCIATSATLGSEDAKDKLAEFAGNIFDEEFDPDDIVTAARIKRTITDGMGPLKPEDYERLKSDSERLSENEKHAFLYNALVKDSRIVSIQKILEKRPMNAEEIARSVFEDVEDSGRRLKCFVTLVELATSAKKDENSNALLPARYHLFVKSLEGMFISLYPRKEVFLERKQSYMSDAGKVTVFELANCQNCGQEYLVGRIVQDKLELPLDNEPREYFIRATEDGEDTELAFDEDDENELGGEKAIDISGLEKYRLCTVCGTIYPADEIRRNCCDRADDKKTILVYRLKKSHRSFEVNGCVKCGSVKPGIIKRFYTSNHAATFAVANSLYDAIPPKESKDDESIDMGDFSDFFFGGEVEKESNVEDERGRKLLIFSDNRQEAAFFAGYLANRHDFIMWRRLILRELEKEPNGIGVGDLINQLKVAAEKNNLYSADFHLTDTEKKNIAARYVLYEFMEMNRKTGLAGRGLIEIFPPNVLKQGMWGMSREETWNLFRFFMDTLRMSYTVMFPEMLSYNDDFFAPRNREVAFRKESGTPVIKAFVPANGKNNKRSEMVRKIFGDTQGTPSAFLDKAFDIMIKLEKAGYFVRKKLANYPKEGNVYAIDYRRWMIKAIPDDQVLYRCKKCGAIATYSIRNKCQVFKCDGEMEEVKASEVQHVPYYYDLYNDSKIIPMLAREHTAQLSKAAAGEYQEDFEKGKINVLSCSTTFEMGVDVGELEATFLRNVPPETANYIQRAGRAGRRTSSTAFAVTFARRNSHDINFYNRPEEIISGKIKPPYIEIHNDKIVSRHINSIILAWFFAAHSDYYFNVNVLLAGDGKRDVAEILKELLDQRPPELLKAIKEVVPNNLIRGLNIDDWAFADRLAGADGTLTTALKMRRNELKQLRELKDKRYAEGKKVDPISKLIETLEKEGCIEFLASNGVLPKYGFPVDVVDLNIIHNSKAAERIELSRDLKLAISEFAPPSSVVANGYVWTSHALNTVPDKGWPEEFFFECPKCGRIAPDEGMHIGYDESEIKNITKECHCGGTMRLHKFIIPRFGFSTSMESEPKRVGEEKPKRYYSTRTQFWGVDPLDSFQKEQRIEEVLLVGGKEIPIVYSPNGKLAVINRGRNGTGLFVCRVCGFVSEDKPKLKHRNKYGYECVNEYLKNLSLGHTFNSDILKIYLPYHKGNYDPFDQCISTLYAMLEGASIHLGIDRADINGCVSYENGKAVFILYDESAGGAGHVKMIAANMNGVLNEALIRVNGSCGCSEDTSCYGCLRNYGNQFEHEHLIRGAAKEYLEWLLTIS